MPKLDFYHILPYYNENTADSVEQLTKFLSQAYPHINFKFCLKNTFNIASLFRFKDKLPQSVLSSVIYKFQCRGCNASYVGSTRQKFKSRIDQHLGISSRTGRHLGSAMNSAPRSHAEDHNHPFNRSDFTVIDSTSNIDLLTLETLHIYKTKPSLNTMQAAIPIRITT